MPAQTQQSIGFQPLTNPNPIPDLVPMNIGTLQDLGFNTSVGQGRRNFNNFLQSTGNTLNTIGQKTGKGLMYAINPLSAIPKIQNVLGLNKLANNTASTATTTANNLQSGILGTGLSGTNLANIGLGLLDNNIKAFQRDYSGKKGNITQGIDAGFDTATNLISMANPLAGLVLKSGSMVGKVMQNYLGTGTDGMTTGDAILNSSLFSLSPVSWINGWTGKKAHTIKADQDVINSSSYADTASDINNALQYSGKKYGGFSSGARKRANKKIDVAKEDQFQTKGILNQAESDFARQASSQDMYANRYQLLNSGYNQNNIRFGKEGLKFIDSIRELKKKREKQKQIDKDIEEKKDQNILPTGALHARLHNINVEGVKKKKGIPVLKSDGGKVEQIAEIEKEEIIFRKCVTEKLEQLMEDGSDESAIEAGKLLVDEILNNTKDESGFIEKVE